MRRQRFGRGKRRSHRIPLLSWAARRLGRAAHAARCSWIGPAPVFPAALPLPAHGAGSDALLKGDGGDSIPLRACWPHPVVPNWPDFGVRHCKGCLAVPQCALQPVSRPAHKHARQKDRKTTSLACACEAKAPTIADAGWMNREASWHACAACERGAEKTNAVSTHSIGR